MQQHRLKRSSQLSKKANNEFHIDHSLVRSLKFFVGIVCASLLITFAYLRIAMKPIRESVYSEQRTMPLIMMPSPISSTIQVPILMYHYVEYISDHKDTFRQALNVMPHIFEEQLKTLTQAGYTFLTASELADIFDGKKILPQKPILLTFDDGHWDLATDVFPLLRKYNTKATAYIISGLIGQKDFLSDDQFSAISTESALLEIGAHTVHHVALADKILPVAAYEIVQSKRDLEKRLGRQIVSFAYPSGSFDQQSLTLVRQAKFRSAVSTIRGDAQSQKNRYFLYRLRPGSRTGADLLYFLEHTK